MAKTILASNEFLTIDTMGAEYRMLDLSSLKVTGEHDDWQCIEIMQVDGTTLMYWKYCYTRERDRDYRQLQSVLADYTPSPVDLQIKVGTLQIESRLIRSYIAMVGEDYSAPRFDLYLHGATAPKRIYFDSYEEGQNFYAKFLAQLHGVSEREARVLATCRRRD